MEILLTILVTYGISLIIVYGSIFEGLREKAQLISPNFFGKLLTCMMCTPFWVGFGLSLGSYLSGLTQFSPFYSYGVEWVVLSVFLDSCLISGTTWLIHTLQEHFEG